MGVVVGDWDGGDAGSGSPGGDGDGGGEEVEAAEVAEAGGREDEVEAEGVEVG